MCCFRKKPFEELMSTTPHIAQRLLEMTLDELDAAREWMLLLGRKTAREKIASFLTILARRENGLKAKAPKGQISFDLPLTREEMADYLGLTLETVSRQMSRLKSAGVIGLPGGRLTAGVGLGRDDRLGAIGNAVAGGLQHRNIVRAVAGREPA